jgi:hypothetical protein
MYQIIQSFRPVLQQTYVQPRPQVIQTYRTPVQQVIRDDSGERRYRPATVRGYGDDSAQAVSSRNVY